MVRSLILPALVALPLAAPAADAAKQLKTPKDRCTLDRLDPLKGQPWADVADRAKKLSHTKSARVVRPGEMVSAIFVPGRLTVRLDPAGRLSAFSCG